MTMICAICNRPGIRWIGPPSMLSHTECPHCGGVNCQRAAGEHGPEVCATCDGAGSVPSGFTLTPSGTSECSEDCPDCDGSGEAHWSDTAAAEPETSKPREPDSWDRIMRRSVSR